MQRAIRILEFTRSWVHCVVFEMRICFDGWQEMLKDEVRTRTYMHAIHKNRHLFKDKVKG